MRKVLIVMGVMCILCLEACGKSEESVKETIEPVVTEAVVEETESTEPEETVEEVVEESPVIYDKDDGINLYLVRYNEANPDNQITGESFEVYHHNGKDNENQIVLQDSGAEVVISCFSGGKTEISLEGDISSDEYKEIFSRYARVYNSNLSNDVLSGYWNEAINNAVSTTDFEEFEIFLQMFNGAIDCVKVTGYIE